MIMIMMSVSSAVSGTEQIIIIYFLSLIAPSVVGKWHYFYINPTASEKVEYNKFNAHFPFQSFG
jgi:hypothetical protein